jgi:hypothetical protein
MKITKKAAARIAQLINDRDVGEIIAKSFKEKKDYTECRKWQNISHTATVELFDEFGIMLPTYEQAVAVLARQSDI